MPRSTAQTLREQGFGAEDVRDVGLRGGTDDEVFDHAQSVGATLVTADLDFANIVRFPLGTHGGIVVLRVPDTLPTHVSTNELVRALKQSNQSEVKGSLLIVELGRGHGRAVDAVAAGLGAEIDHRQAG